jgi:SAM-dependent MidA family methyltransferase
MRRHFYNAGMKQLNNIGDSLPLPPETALQHSAKLSALIGQAISDAGGALSFEQFMQLCLYTPQLGYYAGGAQKFGAGGDFTTAPEMTPLFGAALAHQVSQVLQAMPQGAVLEFGAGTGKLAAQVLKALKAQGMSPRYFILEVSADLRARQRDTIAQLAPQCIAQVQWLDALPEAFEGVVIANEVLDAMPVQVLVKRGDVWRKRCVALEDEQLVFVERDSELTPPVDWHGALPEGYTTELHTQAHAFMRTLPTWLKCGLALLIDYGFTDREYYHPERSTGTLIAHYQHRAHADVLRYVGLQDITAHINFTAAALAAQDAGMDVLGYTSQARFLLNCGVLQLLEQVPDTQRLKETSAVQKLLAEHEMGELFKVLVLGKYIEPALSGFAQGDRLHVL